MEKILLNQAKCLICGEVLTSEYTHDFKTCQCGNLSVDGGKTYIKRCFKDYSQIEELSVSEYKNTCSICSNQAIEYEPRFNYFLCKEHQHLTPVEVGKLKRG